MSQWQLELPAGLDDTRYRGFLAVLRRLDALPIERVLVWHIESAGADVLSHLAEFFSVSSVDWAAGPSRDVLKRGIDLVRRRGTIGALRTSLAAVGYGDAQILERISFKYDGSKKYDGRWRYGADAHYAHFVVSIDVPTGAELPTLAQLRELWDVTLQWSRARCSFAIALLVDGVLHSQWRERPAAAPSIASLVPPSMSATGGVLEIRGANFVAGAVVTIGGVPATDVVVVSPLRIWCFAPPRSAGEHDVIVTNPDAQSSAPVSLEYVNLIWDPALASDVTAWWLAEDADNSGQAAVPFNLFEWPARETVAGSSPDIVLARRVDADWGDLVHRDVGAPSGPDGSPAVVWDGVYPSVTEISAGPSYRNQVDWFGPYVSIAGEDTYSYTIAMVLKPIATSNSDTLQPSNGALVGGWGPTIAAYWRAHPQHQIQLIQIAGEPHVGVLHARESANDHSVSSPVLWPGGWGSWGLLVVTYDAESTELNMRINGVDNVQYLGRPTRTTTDGRTIIGCTNNGSPRSEFALSELMFCNTAWSPAELAARQLRFEVLYPSLFGGA